jgi:hypothetical protein
MDTKQIGPSTPAHEAAYVIYQEAMLLLSQGAEYEEVLSLLAMAQACALVSLARRHGA